MMKREAEYYDSLMGERPGYLKKVTYVVYIFRCITLNLHHNNYIELT